jgi:hypothetical protein
MARRRIELTLMVFLAALSVNTVRGAILLSDDFADGDFTNDPAWSIVTGAFDASANELAFEWTERSIITLDLLEPNTVLDPGTSMIISFNIRLADDWPGAGEFTMHLVDTDTGLQHIQYASTNAGAWGGPSGFHSYLSDGAFFPGKPGSVGRSLYDAFPNYVNVTYIFDPISGVEFYWDGVLMARWANFTGQSKVNQIRLDNTNNPPRSPSNGLAWFIDDLVVCLYDIEDHFIDGDYTQDPPWTVNSGTLDASSQVLNFDTTAGTEIQLDFGQLVNDFDSVQVDLLLNQENGTAANFGFDFILEDAVSGKGFWQSASTNPLSYGGNDPNFASGFHSRDSAGDIISSTEPGAFGSSLAQAFPEFEKVTMLFNPLSGFEFWFRDLLVAKWNNFDGLAQVNRLRLANGNGVVTWNVDHVRVKVTERPTIVDLFTDLDFTNDPPWSVVTGSFDASDQELAFDFTQRSIIALDIPGVEENSPMSASFKIRLADDWTGDGSFITSLVDTDTGKEHIEYANTFSEAWGGPSGFHSYLSDGAFFPGEPASVGRSLHDAFGNYVTMKFEFNPNTGVRFWFDGELMAQWTNFNGQSKVNRIKLDNTNTPPRSENSGLGWFIDDVEIRASTSPACGDASTVYLEGDITGAGGNRDCQVDMIDLTLMNNEWLDCTDPATAGCQNLVDNRSIPEGTATVDADLGDWADADWIDLDQSYSGTLLNDVSGARFAARWDGATDRIYLAVVVPDTDNRFEDDPNSWNTSDRIEVYSQGSGAGGGNYSANQDFAQQYVLGITASDNDALWAHLANGDPNVGVLLSAGAVDTINNELIYELGVKQYDNYDASGAGTVVTELDAGDVVRLDVVVGTLFFDTFAQQDAFAQLAENTVPSKFDTADNIVQYTLTQSGCGVWGFLTADITGAGGSKDCVVNLVDFSAIAGTWMQCSDPADPGCDIFWK